MATGASIYLLSLQVTGNKVAACLSLALLAPSQFALGGARTLDPLLLNRGAALPIELLAISALATGRTRSCFLLLGFAANIHVPSAAALSAALFSLHWLSIPSYNGAQSRRKALLAPLFCPLAAAPVLLMWLMNGGLHPEQLFVDSAWRAVLEARLSHHLFASSWPIHHWLQMAAWLLPAGACLLLLRNRSNRSFIPLCIAALMAWALICGELLGERLNFALALQLEAWQAFRFITMLCAILISAGLAELIRDKAFSRSLALLAAVATIGLTWHAGGPERRHFLPLGDQGEPQQLAAAVTAHVPKAARIFRPPTGLEDLRWRTGRSQSLTWKDGGEALFNRSFALHWKQVMETNCNCQPFTTETLVSDSDQRLASLRRTLRSGNAQLSLAELILRARSEEAGYLIAAAEISTGAAEVKALYQNGRFALYSLSSAADSLPGSPTTAPSVSPVGRTPDSSIPPPPSTALESR